MKKIMSLVLAIVVSVSLVACSGGATTSVATPAPSTEISNVGTETKASGEVKEIKLGYSMPSLVSTVWVANQDYFLEEAEKYNTEHPEVHITPVITIADNDANMQHSQIMDLINNDCDVIFCAPVDSTAIWPSVTESINAGIPMIALGRKFSDGAPTPASATYAWDVKDSAYQGAKKLLEMMINNGFAAEDIKPIHIVGDLRDENAVLYMDGVRQAFDEYGVKEIALVESEWKAETCQTRLAAAVQANPEVNYIYCPNDSLVGAVQSVLDRNGMWKKIDDPGHVYVCSAGGNANGLEYLRDGYLDFNIVEPIRELMRTAIEQGVAIAMGQQPKDMVLDCYNVTLDMYDEYAEKCLMIGLDYE